MTEPVHPFDPPAHERHWIETVTELARDFAASAAEFDDTAELPIANLRALHATGLDRATLPAELGGEDLSYRSYGEIVRILSAACSSTACIWVMHIGAAVGLAQLSAPDMGRFYAEELIDGKRFANALSEPSSGNMFLMPQQIAEPADGGYRLTGAKRFVSGCEAADHFLVNALVDGVPTFFGVSPDDTMTFVPIWDTMGLRASRSQLVSFEGTLLREDRRCPPSAEPRPNHIAAGLAFLSLGIADAAEEALVSHARGRVIPATGQPLAEMQWLQFEAADVHARLEAARVYSRNMAWLADRNSPEFMPATMTAKVLANDIARDVAQLALKTGGGSGFLRTSPIQRLFRDAQAGGLMAYSAEVCKDRIGKTVLLPQD
ncbi:acyl-CoA dehydrogenase family protein [Amycolatopsis roodepoortensis]|uniref:Alkylation response protein AidB-like acyl-CoA dehydrogenase n=1 Tax=Amycolatopsis roodepoortensis TaxID=700274 RepID=A0ABR9L611_9PSEU|nr:acyl-CoA dehydrogenase family protein [Amycolatopsis roodepoortensis]MBE1576153.1 alkylation response protein AidB-like acyl-CoA dehydrogenase [Amycolatopsis roodepoortensis]